MAEYPSLAALRWLLDEWTSWGESRITTETWTEVGPDTFEGFVVSRSPDTGDTTPVETLRLVAMSGGVFYIAKVPEHPLPICFRLTASEERTAIFENPDHDFPQVIAYRLDNQGVLTVRVADSADEGFTLRYTKGNTGQSGRPSSGRGPDTE